ncbi:MAG: DEAD/DEAH box helicase [Candidatus Aminicenantes bacterium]|nr:DEAD/DEAH box helicase [Candidatus Aminicenantes bacterium]
MRFEELGLHPRLQQAIADRGYTDATEVQERTLAVTLRGGDAAVQSQTGTGKTAAFLITIYESLLRSEGKRGRALIIAPTRELAVQIEGEALRLGKNLGFDAVAIYGGVGYEIQEKSLRHGVDIVVGTPGRLLDMDQKKTLDLHAFDILVIDEADRLFDMGFLPDLRRIARRLPPPGVRQSMLFSATLDRAARSIATVYLNEAVYIELSSVRIPVDAITQELYQVKSHLKLNLLLGILAAEKPHNALIFTNMKYEAERLARKLERNGFKARHISGDLPQAKRLRVMEDFQSGKFPILVATDVAARGLHIDALDLVVNYDLPQESENYVHRIGRTGRAGATGKAVSFACEKFLENLYPIERYIGGMIPEKRATASMYAIDRSVGIPEAPRERSGGRGRDRSGGGQGRQGGGGGRPPRSGDGRRGPRLDSAVPPPSAPFVAPSV